MKIKEPKVPYLDYQKLKAALGDDSHERRSIGLLVKKGAITRVKKGLYLWGEKAYSREVLSNLIFGPSYVSLEYALFYHGLTPERVEVVTAVTTKKKKEFETPVGLFTYEHLNAEVYPWGQTLIQTENGFTAMMASPEKAILDTIALRMKKDIEASDFENILFSDLRVDEDLFSKLDRDKLLSLCEYYKNKSIKSFSHFLKLRG